MPQHAVAIGASAGGLEALTAIMQRLPRSMDAASLAVMHTRANGNAVLPAILACQRHLPVACDDPTRRCVVLLTANAPAAGEPTR